MALLATHIRFAVCLKDQVKISDLGKYISGTVYPDSRYLTGIDRNLTHYSDLENIAFSTDDFKKGWMVHYLCDKSQRTLMRKLFPEMHKGKTEAEWWINFSALKNVHDAIILKDFDVKPYLEYLDYVENPSGEDVQKIKAFNKLIQEMYSNKNNISIDDCEKMWLDFGVEGDVVKAVIDMTRKFFEDELICQKLTPLFLQMVDRYKFL
jgi:hypothetical protein